MAEEKKQYKCEDCGWRKHYERKPKSILGRIWKWHTGFCPGWKAYQESLKVDSAGTGK